MFIKRLFQKKIAPSIFPGIILKAVFFALIISVFFFQIDRKAPSLLSTPAALASYVISESQSAGPVEVDPEDNYLYFTIHTTEEIAKVTLELNSDYTSISDLTVSLKSPQGTESVLFDSICSTQNGMLITLDDDAPVEVGQNCAEPYTGTFNTGGRLDAFIGENPKGTWELNVYCGFQHDHGQASATLSVFRDEDDPTPVPTLGHMGLVLLGAFLAFLGFRKLKNRGI